MASNLRVRRNIAGCAVSEGMEALALRVREQECRERGYKWLRQADKIAEQVDEHIRKANNSSELASRQIDAQAREQLVGVA